LTVRGYCPDNETMRLRLTAGLFLPVASISTAGLLALTGCFSDTAVDDTPETFDASPDANAPGVDATMTPDTGSTPMMEAAAPTSDAGVDASPDVAEEPAAPPPVTVVVRGPSGPESRVTIVFSDSTGAFLSQATTDANGRVVQELPANSMVTAVLGSSDLARLTTVTGVQPGDVLTAVDGSTDLTSAISVLAPPSSPPGTVSLAVYAGNCSGSTLTDAEDLHVSITDLTPPYCVGPTGQFPLLALALDDDSTTRGYAFQKGFTVATDGGVPDITMSSAWQTQLGQETVSFSNVPANLSPYVLLEQYASAVPYTTSDDEPNVADGGGASSFETYPGYSDFLQTEVEVNNETSGGATKQAIATRANAPTTAQPTGTIAIDFSTALPAITGVDVDATNPVRPSVTITAAAALTGAAGVFVTLDWANVPDGGDGPTSSGNWVIVGPGSATTIQVPALPATLPGPLSDAQWFAESAAAVGGGVLTSYDVVRSSAATLNQQLGNGSPAMLPGLPQNGTMSATLFTTFSEPPTERL
jgi:hypothetical protein